MNNVYLTRLRGPVAHGADSQPGRKSPTCSPPSRRGGSRRNNRPGPAGATRVARCRRAPWTWAGTYERAKESGESRLPNFDIVLDTFARNLGVA